ncbi:DEAD/DEAH box helicase [Peredibacter starrii]|uniref:RNA helicase n=1 Tax=Peredibacter starrii TaxID=28202 RepID=A0AAX4HN69_9BACT|nr:DEAD/DEAH box helicase [Peredibacter starrii]WPU64643.1 DEAD/DEAH box helicase [Peredibacter starrii]
MSFNDLGLKESSLKAIAKMGFENPSEIQTQAIPVLMQGDVDFIGQAQTGSGKTAAFVLPLLEKLDFKSPALQAIILAPTRELANQINEEIQKLSAFEPIRSMSVYGGTSVGLQIKDFKSKKPQVVAGTPGRVMDLIDRGVLKFDATKFVILDEADEMLDMGFFDDVTAIIDAIPEKRIWMFSATLPGPISDLVNREFSNPVTVRVTKKVLTADTVEQKAVVVRRENGIEALCRYMDFSDDMYAIIFTRTKIGAKELTDELNARGYPTDALHGDMDQAARDMTMKKFKEKKINLLVCTDVAARGIDVNNLTHVINFGLPQDNESYVHRIGRTGRGGSKGVSLSIIEPNEQGRVGQIERLTKAKIERVFLPKVNEIREKILEKSLKRFTDHIESFHDEEVLHYDAFKAKFDELDKEEIIKGIYGFMFENTLKRYQKAQEIDVAPRGQGGERQQGARVQTGMQRFFINLGTMDGANAGELLKFVSSASGVAGRNIGRIETKEKFAFLEASSEFTDAIMNIKGEMFGNRRVSIELATAPAGGGGGRGFGGGGYRGGNRGGDRGGRSGGYRGNRY